MSEGVARCRPRGMLDRPRPSPAGHAPAREASSIPLLILFTEERPARRAVGPLPGCALSGPFSPHLAPGSP